MEKEQENTEKQTGNAISPSQAVRLQPAPASVNSPIDALEHAIIPPEEQSNGKRSFVSTGEHIHKWSTYLSVDWIYNATAGAAFAYWGKFTPSGQAIWSKPVDAMFTTALTPVIKNPENLKWSVRQGNTFMSIIAGGMLTIPPLLILENKDIKLSIIKNLDAMVYGKEKVENDPQFQQAYDEIQHAPEKDFWTGMTSRFAALAPLLASVLIPQSRDFLVKNLFTPVGAKTKVALAGMGLPASKLFKKFPVAEQQARWNYIHDDAIAMDLSFGLPYAVMHAYFYDKFASGSKGKNTEEQSDLPKHAELVQSQSAKHPSQSFVDYVGTTKPSSVAVGAA